jgi:circadian clock protein KaiC
MHFLTEGVKAGEKALFITLGEPESQLCSNAEAVGFDVSGIDFLDLSPTSEFFSEMESYDIFSPAEVERDPTTQKIIETVKQVNPSRIFIDSMTQFKYLTTDNFQFRKQVLSFLRFLAEKNATVMFTSEGSAEAPDEDLQFPVHQMIERKTLSVVKVEPLRYSPSEFAALVRQEVEEQDARIVMIDSMAGYRVALRGEDLTSHIHALGKYLANMGVTVLLLNEVEYITGEL